MASNLNTLLSTILSAILLNSIQRAQKLAQGQKMDMLLSLADTSVCPKPCTCAAFEGAARADCSRSELIEIPADWSGSRLVRLDASFNEISTLRGANYFTMRSLNSLRILSLAQCNLRLIEPHVFDGMRILSELDLSGNRLHELPDGMWNDMRMVKIARLSSNQFSRITHKTFEHATGLEYIDLSRNRLDTIAKNAFSHLPRLRRINFAQNSFTSMTPAPFDSIQPLQFLIVDENPWKCDCHLRTFVSWYKRRYLGEAASCSEPPRHASKHFDQLTPDDFACAPTFEQSLTAHAVGLHQLGGTAALLCAVGQADPKPNVVWSFRAENGTRFGENKLTDTSRHRFETREAGLHTYHFTLTISPTTQPDLGTYICTVSNSADSVVEMIDLKLLAPHGEGVKGELVGGMPSTELTASVLDGGTGFRKRKAQNCPSNNGAMAVSNGAAKKFVDANNGYAYQAIQTHLPGNPPVGTPSHQLQNPLQQDTTVYYAERSTLHHSAHVMADGEMTVRSQRSVHSTANSAYGTVGGAQGPASGRTGVGQQTLLVQLGQEVPPAPPPPTLDGPLLPPTIITSPPNVGPVGPSSSTGYGSGGSPEPGAGNIQQHDSGYLDHSQTGNTGDSPRLCAYHAHQLEQQQHRQKHKQQHSSRKTQGKTQDDSPKKGVPKDGLVDSGDSKLPLRETAL